MFWLFQWHALTREEQAKYYEQVSPAQHTCHSVTVDSFILDLFKARKERQLHMQMYPGWSARDNYAQSKEVNIITGYNNY